MASLNKVMVMGNLTKDPEVRYTPKGDAVTNFSIAINRNYTGDNGEKREDVTFVDIQLWKKLAELAGQYLKRGSGVFIEGRIKMEQWEDKQTGQKRTKMIVTGEVLQFIGAKQDGGERPQGNQGGQKSHSKTLGDQQQSNLNQLADEDEDWDDKIPF